MRVMNKSFFNKKDEEHKKLIFVIIFHFSFNHTTKQKIQNIYATAHGRKMIQHLS